jgi:hypothetical protein
MATSYIESAGRCITDQKWQNITSTQSDEFTNQPQYRFIPFRLVHAAATKAISFRNSFDVNTESPKYNSFPERQRFSKCEQWIPRNP